jgi:hypothetical protein
MMPRVRTHPGEVLREEYLVPLGMSARTLAKALGVPANRITEIMRGERDVPPIRRSGSDAISEPTRGSGSISRLRTIYPWPNAETMIPTSDLAPRREEPDMRRT